MIILYDIGEKSKFPQDIYTNNTDINVPATLLTKKDLYIYNLGIKDNMIIAETDAIMEKLIEYNINFTVVEDITQYEDYKQLIVNNAFGEKLTQKVLEAYTMLRVLPEGHYTKGDFLSKLFYKEELERYYRKADPAFTATFDMDVYIFNQSFKIITENDVNTYDERIIKAINYFASIGILNNADRVAEILSGKVVS